MSYFLFVVSGPAGSGKTTLVENIVSQHSEISRLVTTTTRSPRKGEEDGIDYYFKNPADFEKMLEDNQFVEHASYNNNYYGLTKNELYSKLEQGPAIAILDVQGAAAIRELEIPHKSIFIKCSNINELIQRLHDRAADSPESIKNRLAIAANEMLEAGKYDFCIRNHEIEEATQELWNYIRENSEEKS